MRQSDINSCRDNNSFNYNGVATELPAMETPVSSLSSSTPSTTTRESKGKLIFSPERPVTWTLLSPKHKSTESPVSNSDKSNNTHLTKKLSKTKGYEEKEKSSQSESTTNLKYSKYFKLKKRKLSYHDQKRVIEKSYKKKKTKRRNKT